MNYKNIGKKIIIITFAISIIITSFVVFVNLYINNISKWYINNSFDIKQNTKNKPIWLVLGASVNPDGNPSDILKDRLDTAKEYYNKWIISKIIVSGDNGKKYYNEPINMQKYLIKNGIAPKDIYVDYAGFDTYDSIYRANYIFGAKNLVIFSQRYHLPRAVYIWKKLWLKVFGAISDKHKYIYIKHYKRREIFANIKAFWDANIYHSKPKFLWNKIKINYWE